MALYLGNNKVKLNAYSGDYKFKDGKLIWANPDLYIASTGKPYIDTGYICNTNTKVDCVFSPISIDTAPPTQTQLFGTGGKYLGTDVFNFHYWIRAGAGDSVWWPYIGTSGSGSAISNFAWEMCEKYKVIMNGKTNGPQELYYNNGELIKSFSTNNGFTGSQNTLFLFKLNGNEGKETAKKRIYSFKIYEDDVLIHNFVPVPKGLQIGDFTVSSNGMFDMVNQKFYANSGSGEFEYGKDIVQNDASFSKVNVHTMQGDYLIKDGKLLWANPDLYLKSSGTQYIDTGYIGNNNTRIETDFIYNKPRQEIGESGFSPWNFFYGSYNNSNATGGISLYIYEDKVGSKQSSYFEQNVIDKTIFNKGAGYLIKQDKDGLYINNEFINSYTQQVFNNTSSTCLFTINKHDGKAITYGCSCLSVYYFKIYENNILVRHLVPVPAGLQIGSFTVPSNGMFDIVEQKFYANQGAGEFEFGGNQSDYVISDGKLLWANPNLYLKGDGKSFIECNDFQLNQLTTFDISVCREENQSRIQYIFGSSGGSYRNNCLMLYSYITPAGNYNHYLYYRGPLINGEVDTSTGLSSSLSAKQAIKYNFKTEIIDTKYKISTNVNNDTTYSVEGIIPSTLDIPETGFEIFGAKGQNLQKYTGKIYHLKIYDNNVLLYNFVPVYKGLKIGTFTVPSNGMFDIVEQKFYPNEGTGEFLINKDE